MSHSHQAPEEATVAPNPTTCCHRACTCCCRISRVLFLYILLPIVLSVGAYMQYQCLTFDHEAEILADGGQFVILPDGRYLEYFVFGSEADLAAPLKDTKKDILLFLHGSFGTGRGHIADPDLYKHFVFLQVSLPAHGGSSPAPLSDGWTVFDYPLDIAVLLQHLDVHLRDIFVMGESYGSYHAYALACGNGSHQLRVKKYALACPFAAPARKLGFLGPWWLADLYGYVLTHIPSLAIASMDQEELKIPKILDLVADEMFRSAKFTNRGLGDTAFITDDPKHRSLRCPQERVKAVRDRIRWSFGTQDDVCPRPHLEFYLEEFGLKEREGEVVLEFDGLGHFHCFAEAEEIIRWALLES